MGRSFIASINYGTDLATWGMAECEMVEAFPTCHNHLGLLLKTPTLHAPLNLDVESSPPQISDCFVIKIRTSDSDEYWKICLSSSKCKDIESALIARWPLAGDSC
jgi:hypothetical protein